MSDREYPSEPDYKRHGKRHSSPKRHRSKHHHHHYRNSIPSDYDIPDHHHYDIPDRPENIPGRPENIPGRPENIPGRPENIPGRPENIPGLYQLPTGTRIYLKKKDKPHMFIQPDKILPDDMLYVAYDVRVNGETVIPRDTRVIGNWITESRPTIAAQLQVKQIILSGSEHSFNADSEVIEPVKLRTGAEGLSYVNRKTTSKCLQPRVLPNMPCCMRTLEGSVIPYLEIPTSEIPVTLKHPFDA